MNASAIAAPAVDLEALLERHRSELIGYCSRMLGSASEAEDAVQVGLGRTWGNGWRKRARRSIRSLSWRNSSSVPALPGHGLATSSRQVDELT